MQRFLKWALAFGFVAGPTLILGFIGATGWVDQAMSQAIVVLGALWFVVGFVTLAVIALRGRRESARRPPSLRIGDNSRVNIEGLTASGRVEAGDKTEISGRFWHVDPGGRTPDD